MKYLGEFTMDSNKESKTNNINTIIQRLNNPDWKIRTKAVYNLRYTNYRFYKLDQYSSNCYICCI